jgi:hypothetical protein
MKVSPKIVHGLWTYKIRICTKILNMSVAVSSSLQRKSRAKAHPDGRYLKKKIRVENEF